MICFCLFMKSKNHVLMFRYLLSFLVTRFSEVVYYVELVSPYVRTELTRFSELDD